MLRTYCGIVNVFYLTVCIVQMLSLGSTRDFKYCKSLCISIFFCLLSTVISVNKRFVIHHCQLILNRNVVRS